MPNIHELMPDPGPAVFYEDEFKRVVEDHLHYLRSHEQTVMHTIDAHIANKYHGDLIGLLRYYDVAEHMHWLVMRVNRYTSPMQFDQDDLTLLFPAQPVINSILKRYRANQKIISKA